MVRHDRHSNFIMAAHGGPLLTLYDAAQLHKVEQRAFVDRLLAHFGKAPLALINQAWAEAAERHLYPVASVETRIRQFWTPLIAILKTAAVHQLFVGAPLKRPKAEALDSLDWLRPKEAQGLIDNSARHLAPLLLFILATGARPKEAIYLQWDAVNLESGTVRLLSSNGRVKITLPHTLLQMMAQFLQKEGTVFRRQDGLPYTWKINAGGQVKTALTSASSKAALPKVTLKMLRHTWAVWWLARHGRDYDGLLEAGRWADERLLARYKKLTDDELKGVLAELDELFPGWLI